MLISVHLPKTAGSSFSSSLIDFYGDKILRDYQDIPLHTPLFKRYAYVMGYSLVSPFKNYHGIDCIHGHFMPFKYHFLGLRQPITWVTWMRDPVERLASHYYYFKRATHHLHPLQQKMIDENWSLEKFCLSPEFRNVYSQFLWGFSLESFDFIGIMEHYNEDMADLSQYLNGDKSRLKSYQVNMNTGDKKASYFTGNECLKKKIIDYHAVDVLLYKKALLIREKRKKLYS